MSSPTLKMDTENRESISYAFNNKMMIVSVIFLFIACFFIVFFHVYSRCFQDRRQRHLLQAVAAVITPKGLPPSVVNSLPTFNYDSRSWVESPVECVVCLSEFEDGEMGRILPECKHCFHVDCIDMWLHSHRDCPLCRTQIKAQSAVKNSVVEPVEKRHEIVISIPEPEDTGMDSSSGLHPTCQNDERRVTCCSSSSSSTTPEVPAVVAQLPGPIGLDQTESEGASERNSNIGLGPDIESGPKPVTSVRLLKRLFSI